MSGGGAAHLQQHQQVRLDPGLGGHENRSRDNDALIWQLPTAIIWAQPWLSLGSAATSNRACEVICKPVLPKDFVAMLSFVPASNVKLL